ncbi:hypothetical protein [Streptomyces sp. NPDC049916]|uniref:hypothetical protein n=1 Tax=Streptomyces sp. NPDC049916 TaxID=3155156 RepID=UPI00343462B7
MEQSIDSNKKPEFAAGTDPAFIPLPGLAAPAPTRKADADAPDDADAAVEAPEADAGKGPQAEPETGAAPRTQAAPEAEAEAEPETGTGTAPEAGTGREAAVEEESAAGKGPVFEVSDRRGSIRVAREGVRFRLDDQEAEFDWDEIGAVETTPARFGRRFTVTVHLSSRRWFNAEVEAPSRAELKTWPAELDAVLDAYFEEA